jgi:hypothetical protein
LVGTVGRSGARVAAAHRATAEVVVDALGLAEHVTSRVGWVINCISNLKVETVKGGWSPAAAPQRELEPRERTVDPASRFVLSGVFVRAHR